MSFEKSLAVHQKALQLRMVRTELLAANLANVNTPNFQAKDIDFSKEMQHAMQGFALPNGIQVKYRVPNQSAQDGNTVELNVEQAAFAKNSLDYQTSLTFLNMKLKGLKQAIEGK